MEFKKAALAWNGLMTNALSDASSYHLQSVTNILRSILLSPISMLRGYATAFELESSVHSGSLHLRHNIELVEGELELVYIVIFQHILWLMVEWNICICKIKPTKLELL